MKALNSWKNKSGIYIIKCKERAYIGSSICLYDRLAVHISQLRGGYHHSKFMQRCFNKYGEEFFTIEILEYLENDLELLRNKELEYINLYESVFNSTTPVTYKHSPEMCEQIRNTLMKGYADGSIKNPRLGTGRKIDIFNSEGSLLNESVDVAEAIQILGISNRSVINNALRVGRPYSKYDRLIIPKDCDYIEYVSNWIRKINGLQTHMYKIMPDGSYIKCTRAMADKIRLKALNSNDLIYFSKKNKCHYTFAGLINFAVLSRNI